MVGNASNNMATRPIYFCKPGVNLNAIRVKELCSWLCLNSILYRKLPRKIDKGIRHYIKKSPYHRKWPCLHTLSIRLISDSVDEADY